MGKLKTLFTGAARKLRPVANQDNAPSPTSLRAAWQLAKPYFTNSPEKRKARAMLAAVIGLTLGQVYIDVKLSNWGNSFYTTLQKAGNALEQPATPENLQKVKGFENKVHDQLLDFLLLASCFLGVAITKFKINQKLQLNWRQWMTQQYTQNWLDPEHKPYYKMQRDGSGTDNPDQRISEDIKMFTNRTLGLSLGLMRSSLSLPSFTYILYNIAGPGFVVGAAAYAAVSTYIAHKIGKPLVRLEQNQQAYEANFRYAAVSVRNNAESIALQDGEDVEKKILSDKFVPVIQNYNRIINKNMQMTATNSALNQTAIVLPYVIMLPRFFSKEMQLGDFFQGAGAFSQVQTDLSWFFNAYTELADWKAVTNRLTTFSDAIEKYKTPAGEIVPPASALKMA